MGMRTGKRKSVSENIDNNLRMAEETTSRSTATNA